MTLRIGIIGLDNSHAFSLSQGCNGEQARFGDAKVTMAWPGGSPGIPLSEGRVAGFTRDVRDRCGVTIAETPEAVAEACDAIALLSMDGRAHADLFDRIAPYQKPIYINKPLATSSVDVTRITEAANRHGTRWFSASALRMLAPKQATAPESASVECPLWFEPANQGWFWYGIHGVELLHAVMGGGASSLRVESYDHCEILHVKWPDGRDGHVYGRLNSDAGYSISCNGQDFEPVNVTLEPLETQLIAFFAGAPAPVTPVQTAEVIAWVEAANKSRSNCGCLVSL